MLASYISNDLNHISLWIYEIVVEMVVVINWLLILFWWFMFSELCENKFSYTEHRVEKTFENKKEKK